MKKILLSGLCAAFVFAGCQNELYKDAAKDHKSKQGAYIAGDNVLNSFVAEGVETYLNGVVIGLARKADSNVTVRLTAGDQAQLDAYNKKNQTSYPLLPKEMYEVANQVTLDAGYSSVEVPIKLTELAFNGNSTYALPVRLEKGGANIISGQSETLLIMEQKLITKSLKMSGSGAEDGDMFPQDFSVDQWTMEMMINRSSYRSNNKSIGGTKLAPNSSSNDEIYTRFGDVTIDPNQLQIKTGRSQIDVPKDLFAAQPNVWYMISFVYDGKKNSIYIDGKLVAEREIREGAYGLTGFWIGGANELIREIRFWDIARTPKQIKDNVWKTVHPDSKGLLLYYPGNGKKFDRESGKVVEDETKIWDWSKKEKHLNRPSGASFDNNGGEGFVFPPEA